MKIQRERVIDGEPPYDVVMVTPPVVGRVVAGVREGCGDGLHCAAHGAGPFACCRCGAEFRLATPKDRRRS